MVWQAADASAYCGGGAYTAQDASSNFYHAEIDIIHGVSHCLPAPRMSKARARRMSHSV